MPFCENCGNKVNETDRFCENCGHSLSSEVLTDDKLTSPYDCDFYFNVFTNPRWKQNWGNIVKQGNCFRYGIILTNTNDCPPNLKEKFYDTLRTYIDFRAKHNISYCVLDLANQKIKHAFNPASLRSVDFVVDILKDVSNIALPQCLMIVGDRDTIPSIKWSNPLHIPGDERGDADQYIDSDLPYVILDTRSPFENNSFKFKLEVGRIPSVAKTGFPEVQKYFNNTILCAPSAPIKPIVLTAIEWAQTSQVSYSINKELFTCPDYSFVPHPNLHLLDNNDDNNLLCFNLHGLPDGWGAMYGCPVSFDDFWISGDGNVAYSPDYLPLNDKIPYVISTEACYGAKPFIRNTNHQSVLMTALQNRCIGYLGSTQIAYGTVDESLHQLPPYGADVLSGKFSLYVSQGDTIGSAYFKALTSTIGFNSGDFTTNHDIKTISSFALYGDPTVALAINNFSHTKSFSSELETYINVSMSNIRRAVKLKITELSDYITERVDAYIRENFAWYSDVTPICYKLKDYGGYNVTYSKKDSNMARILSMYLDADGNVQKVYASK